MYLRELASICLKPLRIAFDHLGLKGPYEKAVRYAHEFGLTELSNYMLYNFHDTPEDLFERMRLNVTLNEELGIRVWSFPMRFQPTDRADRGHVGKNWSRFQLRSMQIILQATHGVVSGAPDFFKRAFGDTRDEFEQILLHPHDFTFNRDWFENHDPRHEVHEYRSELKHLDVSERHELVSLLSSCDPKHFHALPSQTSNVKLRRVLPFYVPKAKNELFGIWASQRAKQAEESQSAWVSEEERVEDAGLDQDLSIDTAPIIRKITKTKRAAA
jgi:hypothetical protein